MPLNALKTGILVLAAFLLFLNSNAYQGYVLEDYMEGNGVGFFRRSPSSTSKNIEVVDQNLGVERNLQASVCKPKTSNKWKRFCKSQCPKAAKCNTRCKCGDTSTPIIIVDKTNVICKAKPNMGQKVAQFCRQKCTSQHSRKSCSKRCNCREGCPPAKSNKNKWGNNNKNFCRKNCKLEKPYDPSTKCGKKCKCTRAATTTCEIKDLQINEMRIDGSILQIEVTSLSACARGKTLGADQSIVTSSGNVISLEGFKLNNLGVLLICPPDDKGSSSTSWYPCDPITASEHCSSSPPSVSPPPSSLSLPPSPEAA